MTVLYAKRYWGMGLLLRIYGSAIPRTLPAAALSCLMTLMLGIHAREWAEGLWRNQYGFSIYATIVAFLIVFRSNQGYSRYWEGTMQVQIMTSRWTQAAVQAMTWDRGGLKDPADPAQQEASRRFAERILHLVSFMNAAAYQALRRDGDIRNLRAHRKGGAAPPADSLLVSSWNKRRSPESAVDLASEVGHVGFMDLFLLNGGKKRQMVYNRAQPIKVISAPTSEELTALCCPQEDDECAHLKDGRDTDKARSTWQRMWEKIWLDRYEQMAGQVNSSCCSQHVTFMERPMLIQSWLQAALVERIREGGLAGVPPPVLGRIFQDVVDGNIAYEHCRKLADTPFPFPFSQMMVVVLLGFTLAVPFFLVACVNSVALSAILSICSTITYWAINEVACDLEDPFLYEPNTVPFSRQQHLMNETMLAVHTAAHPGCGTCGRTDHASGTCLPKIVTAGGRNTAPGTSPRFARVAERSFVQMGSSLATADEPGV